MEMIKKLFKDFIQSVHPYEPGKPIKELEREMGLRHIIKMASNENPLGPSRKAVRAMRRAIQEVHYYPEGGCFYLVKRLSEELGVPENQFLVGNGSNEIIELLCRGFLSEGDQVISSETSFLVYPILTKICGAEFVQVPMKDMRYDLEAIVQAITDKTKLIFIANPNNPTGTYVTSQEVESFLSKVPKDVIVCFDEAYIDFVEARDFPHMLFHVKADKPNVVILRTFSKAYGLAGLRVGYGIASTEIVSYLHRIRQPFNVNAIAQVAATAALEDRFFLWRTKRLVSTGRLFIEKRLVAMGLKTIPSQANFLLIDVARDADQVFQAFLKEGVIVRSMKAFGLPTYIRVTIGRRSQNAHFCRLLKKILKETS